MGAEAESQCDENCLMANFKDEDLSEEHLSTSSR